MLPKAKESRIYLPLLLLFILGNEVCNNYILNIFAANLSGSEVLEVIFFVMFLAVQIIASPIQAGYSDFYCRKKSLILSLSFSAVSMGVACLYFYTTAIPIFLLSIVAVVKGAFGNVLPLSWAAIADTKDRNFRFSLGLSTSAIALGYLSLIVLDQGFSNAQLSIIIGGIFIALTIVCKKWFWDIRTGKKNNIQQVSISRDIKLIVKDFLYSRRVRKGLLAFILWEVSFYSIHMLDVDLKILEFKGITASMILGYLAGVPFLKILKKSDEQMIKIGYLISIIAILPLLFLCFFFEDIKYFMLPCYFVYAFGAVFLVPCLFSILSKEGGSQEQGKIYGLIDSADTIALLITFIVLLWYNSLKAKPIFMIAASFAIFVISWLPYAEFKKTKLPQTK